MKVTADEMKKSMEEIYSLLDNVSPLDFDCGCLCDEACCVYDKDNTDVALGLYLMPGEELMYEDSDDFNLFYIPSDEVDFPHTWSDDIFMVECINPPHCDRSIRPIQCRTFPLVAHITEDNKFHLILDEEEFPYKCPIIEDDIKLNEDFIETTYNVWNILIRNPIVYDLIRDESKIREERDNGYVIVI